MKPTRQTIPLSTPNLQGREGELLAECVTSTFVSSVGPFVNSFEERIAEISGTDEAAVLCTGTVALQMALEGLGIGDGDLVIVPTLTFIASPNSISHSGARPWLVDVSEQTWMLDPEVCRKMISSETLIGTDGLRRHVKTNEILRAIMPVMVMGAVANLDAIVTLAREFDLKVVVDAAAAIGTSMQDGRLLGETGVNAVCYSFNGNKTITTGGGGAVAAADSSVIARIKHLTSTGRVGMNYDHDIIAYNFRMTNVQAALGVAQIERLGGFLERKHQIRDKYATFAAQNPELEPFPEPSFGHNGHWFSGFWYTGSDITRCDKFRAHMQAGQVDLRPFWKPIHLQTPYLDALTSEMLVADTVWRRIFPLPCSTHLSDADLDYVLELAGQFWGTGHA